MSQNNYSGTNLATSILLVLCLAMLMSNESTAQELAEHYSDKTVPISLMGGYAVGGDVSGRGLSLGIGMSEKAELAFTYSRFNSRIPRNTTTAKSFAFTFTSIRTGETQDASGVYSVTISSVSGSGVIDAINLGGSVAGVLRKKLAPETTIYPRFGAEVSTPIHTSEIRASRSPRYGLFGAVSMVVGERKARFAVQVGISQNLVDNQTFVSIDIGVLFLTPKDSKHSRYKNIQHYHRMDYHCADSSNVPDETLETKKRVLPNFQRLKISPTKLTQ